MSEFNAYRQSVASTLANPYSFHLLSLSRQKLASLHSKLALLMEPTLSFDLRTHSWVRSLKQAGLCAFKNVIVGLNFSFLL